MNKYQYKYKGFKRWQELNFGQRFNILSSLIIGIITLILLFNE